MTLLLQYSFSGCNLEADTHALCMGQAEYYNTLISCKFERQNEYCGHPATTSDGTKPQHLQKMFLEKEKKAHDLPSLYHCSPFLKAKMMKTL